MPRPKASPVSSPNLARRRAAVKAAPVPPGQAEELMELAVDAAQSRRLPEFLERFADRAARMLSADWCGVMVFRGRETDFYQAPPNKSPQDKLGSDTTLHTLLIQHGRELPGL